MLTCLSCRVTFSTNEHQKEHYKSEWHRYNLMRKVVELEPVTFEFFLKVQKSREAEANQQTEQLVYTCTVCRKHFNSNAVLQQHFQSKKHRAEVDCRAGHAIVSEEDADKLTTESQESESTNNSGNEQHTLVKAKPVQKASSSAAVNESEHETEEEWENVDDEESIKIDLNECLFCPIISSSLDESLKHMCIEHSFFVNDLEYCIDLEGLIEYLAEKIKVSLRCIFCPDDRRGYSTLESAQQHMISKGHCKMKTELGDILEWAPFYDYSETYPDKGGDQDKDDEFEINEALQQSDWELVLPSGAVIGHRSLQRFYRQKYNPKWMERAERAKQMSVEDRQHRVNKVMSQYRSLGYGHAGHQNGAMIAASSRAFAMQKARDMKYFSRLRQSHYFLSTIKVKNLASQMHYRAQTLK